MNSPPDRLSNLDVLRALAALAVCLFHFQLGSMFEGSLFRNVARYGNYGVDVFFVISGYVIPLSLWKRKFDFSQAGNFWIARLIRLYPAYFLASVVAFGLWHLSTLVPGFRGSAPPPITNAQMWANLALVTDLARQHWFLEVAWTLAIEAQYYILIAVTYPLLTNRLPAVRVAAVATWALCPLLVSNQSLVFNWTALFGMGLAVMLSQHRLLGSRWLVATLLLSFAVQWWVRGGAGATIGLATALFILFAPPLRAPMLVWVGGISYSLYLLHAPIGGRVINFLERFPDSPWVLICSLPLAVMTSIAAAYLFFKAVELPSHQWARKVRLSKKPVN